MKRRLSFFIIWIATTMQVGCDKSESAPQGDAPEASEAAPQRKPKKSSRASKTHRPDRRTARKKKHTSPNVVVFLIDTLRKDHLSCYGYSKETSPRIDALAKEGMLFEQAVSQAPWTPPSVASIFTSRYPSQLGIAATENEDGFRNAGAVPRLRKRFHTLAEAFRKARYQTYAVSTNMYVSKKFNFLQGFEGKRRKTKARASWVVAQGMRWISTQREAERPFFLYLHFMDTHETHTREIFRRIYYSDKLKRRSDEINNMDFDQGKNLKTPQFAEWKEKRLAIYDGAISYVDNYIGDFVDFLKDERLYKNTVFAVLADHGEEFWDHIDEARKIPQGRDIRGVGHGQSLFGELIEVPMIFHGPKVPATRDNRLVRNLDVAPTLLGLAGIHPSRFLREGRDLLKTRNASPSSIPMAFSESIGYGREAKSIQDERFKLIKNDDYQFFYDKQNDPAEKHDLGARHPEKRAELEKSMEAIVKRITPKKAQRAEKLDPETEKQLKALGYM